METLSLSLSFTYVNVVHALLAINVFFKLSREKYYLQQQVVSNIVIHSLKCSKFCQLQRRKSPDTWPILSSIWKQKYPEEKIVKFHRHLKPSFANAKDTARATSAFFRSVIKKPNHKTKSTKEEYFFLPFFLLQKENLNFRNSHKWMHKNLARGKFFCHLCGTHFTCTRVRTQTTVQDCLNLRTGMELKPNIVKRG